MSRVIKSASVNIRSPKIINHQEPESGSQMIDDEPLQQQEIANEEAYEEAHEEETSLEQAREQAAEVFRETEQMVRELLETAREEAQKIIKKANEEAEQVIAEGHGLVVQIKAEAFEDARQRGYQDGLSAAEAECRAKIQEADALIDSAHVERQEIIKSSEADILRLALAVAQKVVGEELKINSECVIEIVKKAVHKATDREELTVRVNPENLDTAIIAQDEIKLSAAGIRKLKITADTAVSSGGCVVESPNETVDARIERQFEEIEKALMEVGP